MKITETTARNPKGEGRQTLINNYFALALVQGANFILPLITYPYLTRILGDANYGLYIFALNFINYFQLITDYGFNFTGTRDVSIHRTDKKKLSLIYSSIMTIKMLLALVCFIFLCFIVIFVKIFTNNAIIYLVLFGVIVGNVFLPTWFFQGIERMKYITIFNLLIYCMYVLTMILFVKEPDDIPQLAFLRVIFPICFGFLAFFIVLKLFKINILWPGRKELKSQLKSGWPMFISSVATGVYTSSNIFLLGLFTDMATTGIFAAANVIVGAARSMILGPISQAIYPRINKIVHESPKLGLRYIKQLFVLVGGLGLLLSVGIYLFSDILVTVLAGEEFTASINVLRALSFVPFIIALSNVTGYLAYIPFNMKRQLSIISFCAATIDISLCFSLIPFVGILGLVITIVITESFVTITQFIYIYNQNKKGKLFVEKAENINEQVKDEMIMGSIGRKFRSIMKETIPKLPSFLIPFVKKIIHMIPKFKDADFHLIDLSRLKLIRQTDIKSLSNPKFLENILLPRLGLSGAKTFAYPEKLHPFCGRGLLSWQYPNQFSLYLSRIAQLKIESYLEIGTFEGGTFVITTEYLERFHSLKFAIGIDICYYPSLLKYKNMNPKVRYMQIDTQSPQFVDYLKDYKKIDLVLIDGNHEESACRNDFLSVKEKANIIIFHDIVNDECEGVKRVWQEVKQKYSKDYDFIEYTDQYKSVIEKMSKSFLGIGLMIKKERIP